MSTSTASAAPRRYHHPTQKDTVTLLRTSDETNGALTLAEVELAPGGGNELHYHRLFEERFEVVQGTLGVELDGAVHRLGPGERAVAPIDAVHRFFNDSSEPVVFRVEVVPASRAFEQAFQIAYGLARDGRVTSRGLPSNAYHLAVLAEMTGTHLPGWYRVLAPVASWVAALARRRGVDRELIARYCT